MKKKTKILGLFLSFCVCLTQPAFLPAMAAQSDASEKDSTAFAQDAGDAKAHLAAKARSIDGQILSNDYLELAVDSNTGRFTIGTSGGNPDMDSDNHKKMLFGHPSPGTSYTTIVIDDVPYIYGNFSGEDQFFVSAPVFNDEIKCNNSVARYGDIEVSQRLKMVNNVSTGRQDVVEISYMVANKGTQPHAVGSRIMLDTMLGDNDHAPFRIPGTGAVSTQTEFIGKNIPQYWQAFDNLTNPTVISQGSFLRSTENPPDQVQFTNWGQVYDTAFAAPFHPGADNGDSAVAIMWDQKELRPGRYLTYTTHYGLSELTQDASGPLAISLYGDSTISIVDGQYTPNPFDVTAYIENISGRISEIQPTDAINPYVLLTVGEGFEIDESTPARVTFDKIAPDEQKQVSWKVKVTGVQEDSVVPITVTVGADNFEEKQVIKNITIPAAGKDNTLKFGEDNLSFINTDPHFLEYDFWESLWARKDIYKEPYYHISDEYFNLLTRDQGMDQIVCEYMEQKRNAEWGGSCYGMSAVASLMKDGRLRPSAWQESARNAHDLKKPVKSDSVENLVNFYQLSQNLPDIQDIRRQNFLLDESVLLKQLVEETQKVKMGGLPIHIGFSWRLTDESSSGHAIVAYDIQEGNFQQNGQLYKYKLTMYDPNNTEPTYLYIEDNFTGWYYEEIFNVSGGRDKVLFENGSEVKRLTRVFSEVNTIDLINAETRYSRVNMRNYNKNFIHGYMTDDQTISNGVQSATINGFESKGDLSISVIPDDNISADGQSSNSGTIFLPDEEAVYTLSPAKQGDKIDASMVFTDRVLAQAKTESGKSVTYSPEGSVNLKGNNSDYGLSLTFNSGNSPLPVPTIEVNGDGASDTTLEKAEDGVLLTGDNLEQVEISARDLDKPSAIFDVNTDQNEILIKSDENGEIQAYIDANNDDTFETVLEKTLPVEVELDPQALELKRGETYQITAKTTPAPGATDETIVWTTSDPAVVAVDQNGKITAIAKGDATITATTVQGSRADSCLVKVTEADTPTPTPGKKNSHTSTVTDATPSISLLWSSASVPVGGTSYITVITDASTAPQAVSSNAAVASVAYYDKTSQGYRYQVTGVSSGAASIGFQIGGTVLPQKFAVTVTNASSSVKCDTTLPFSVKHSSAYCFKITVLNGSNAVPSFTVGNGSVFKTQFVAKIGSDYYYRIWAVGAPGQSAGVYTQMPGEAPQKQCVVTIA